MPGGSKKGSKKGGILGGVFFAFCGVLVRQTHNPPKYIVFKMRPAHSVQTRVPCVQHEVHDSSPHTPIYSMNKVCTVYVGWENIIRSMSR